MKRALILLALFAASVGAGGRVLAASFIQLDSQPQSFAQSQLRDRSTGVVAAELGSSGLTVTWNGSGGHSLSVRFQAPIGGILQEGAYEDSAKDAGPGYAGLDVSVDGSSCYAFYGRFVVREVVTDGNRVVRFAADFEEHCIASEPGTYGGVRFESDVPYNFSGFNPYPPASLQVFSQAGDPAGQGRDSSFARPDFFELTRDSQGAVQVMVLLPNVAGPAFIVTFAPPPGATLTVGTYEHATRYPFNTGTDPGFGMSGGGSGCETTSRFTVRELELGAQGAVKKFAADFEYRCGGPTAPGGNGAVRYNSVLAYSPPTLALPASNIEYVDDLRFVRVVPGTSVPIAVRVVNSQGAPVANAPVQFFGSCGGAAPEVPVSDANGIASTRYFAPPTAVQCGSNVLQAMLRSGSASVILPFSFVWSASGTTLKSSFAAPNNAGTIDVSLEQGGINCSLTRASVASAPPPPAGVVMPFGVMDFRTTGCDPGSSVSLYARYPRPLPPSAMWWTYGPTKFDRTPHWYPGGAIVRGNTTSLGALDGWNDDDLGEDGKVGNIGGVGVDGGLYQDLWWSGAQENGWGMSILQHGDALFANLFVYDAQGKPVWYVMPSGTWNAARTAFTGALYLPHGAPFYAYDASRHAIGASVGTATIFFTDANNASFDYTIGGVSGHKVITKIRYGSEIPLNERSHADLWWGGAQQNGWGIALLQQYSTLFLLWFTYDANGDATWYVMPGGTWFGASPVDYGGKIYRPVGPAWLGVTYDASRHRTIEVGTFQVKFTGETATFDYVVDGRSGSIPLSRIPF